MSHATKSHESSSNTSKFYYPSYLSISPPTTPLASESYKILPNAENNIDLQKYNNQKPPKTFSRRFLLGLILYAVNLYACMNMHHLAFDQLGGDERLRHHLPTVKNLQIHFGHFTPQFDDPRDKYDFPFQLYRF